MSTASVLMAGTGTNTSRIPYSSMSVLEIFYDYCVSGVDFSLPGNGGKASVQQCHLSSNFAIQCCNLPQLLYTRKNVSFHLNLHLNIQF